MFSSILKELRIAFGLTQEQLAERAGLAKSTISMYENGNREPDLETLEIFADIFNVDMNKLTGNKKSILTNFPKNILPLPKMKLVPLIGTIACGAPLLADENIEEYIKAPENISAEMCLRCKGESMINARIYDGDLVFIRQQPDVDNGEIAAVLIDDEATLKRVYKYLNKLVLQPENPAFEPLVYVGEEMNHIRIIGKAVAFLSTVR